MSRIKILPEILSNKIAAGEVVERPASVVKELVENSLDARSRRIMVEVEKGGRSLIRVSDNGIGMGHDDALLALERYATSKIYTDQDLFSISTLGFRGEALPSIAAVSRFAMVTRHQAADSGTEILVDGGKIKKVSETGAPTGTMITVRQLFFNTPARRKFLKSVATEMSHIADNVARIAVARPGVQFRLVHNNKTVKDWPAAASPFQRIIDVVGNDLQNELHPMEFSRPGVTISGWTSSPRVTRSTSRGLYVYVNQRFIRDRIIQHALFQGYSQRLVKGQFPVAVVFIDVAPDTVDVNVHPTKNEVRFSRQHDVHEAVKQAVAKTLYEVDRPQWGTARHKEIRRSHAAGRVSEASNEFGIRPATSSAESDAEFGKKRERFESFDSRIQKRLVDENVHATQPTPRDVQTELETPGFETPGRQAALWHKGRFSDLRTIGQFRNTYIVCESDNSLILIDQHAAHERILFEKLRDRSQTAPKAGQRLLVPETV
ncbi:MAG: DNA mismatch repair endonuclease MutL, partial [Deltaproteobacteria bacterium]|nr:DNA mismatch repair endonuclease MutL [Deltaproteobacteria bacterium]